MTQTLAARALVIDDVPEEALPVIQALQLLGIGAVFYNGGVTNPFGSRLKTPRLLFLDMVLAEHGASDGDPEGCHRIIFEALERVVEMEGGPLFLVAWSSHQTLVEGFEAAFQRRFAVYANTKIIYAAKPAFELLHQTETLNYLRDVILNGLKDLNGVGVLLEWERMVSSAAARTTARILELAQSQVQANSDSRMLIDAVTDTCGELSFAEGGSRLAEAQPGTSLECLLHVLLPLLVDRLEHFSHEQMCVAYGETIKTSVIKAKSRRDLARKAKAKSTDSGGTQPLSNAAQLNSMLCLSAEYNAQVLQPGSVYLLNGDSGGICGFPAKMVVDDVMQSPVEDLTAVLVECTPPCDYSQGKRKVARFVGAAFVPIVRHSQIRKSAEYLRTVGPVVLRIGEQDVEGILVVNAHFIGSALLDSVTGLHCLTRLRGNVLTDIMNWLGGHIARPGYVYL